MYSHRRPTKRLDAWLINNYLENTKTKNIRNIFAVHEIVDPEELLEISNANILRKIRSQLTTEEKEFLLLGLENLRKGM